MTFDETVRYQDSHEWVRSEGETARIGISDYAQDELGDVVFVELPEAGTSLKKGQPLGVVESVKAASDLYMPVSGTVVSRNEALKDAPETINQDPFGAGWIITVKLDDPAEMEALMDSTAYKSYTEGLKD
ncbi:glycine cleavage system protein H [Alkalispirochaeta sphaeroplastigenens]|uniref:Glycine cleavage system H protein n=1 Tax=Alkalispirochaeta sphaeroplastigenens TaxID=1187066 RepID=A0A2S4K0S6_9SPIO|nr:glycine cleavage system protein GcvH [Alkalispirochaeta sphaeroplastigenens]POR05361.1 glycine cleavage system protein H [Alkalispirochaeta sphaeroplastigenens]